MVNTALAAIGVAIGAVGAYLALGTRRSARRRRSIDVFKRARSLLKRPIGELYARSLVEQERFRRTKEVPMLTREHWIPSRPLPLGNVMLRLSEPSIVDDLAEARQKVARYLPSREDGGTLATYSEAVALYDRPQVWFDSCAYRLLDVVPLTVSEPTEESLELTFGYARYFDGQDTSEFLGHEAAARAARRKRVITGGAYRAWLADPFDFSRRAAMPGISTLTIRRSSRGGYFFMHRRDPDKVAVAMNATNAAPAGKFQPHNDVRPVWRMDLNIWHNMMREYAEEFLGQSESAGRGGSIIDYEHTEPYSQFTEARRQGAVKIRFLCIGLDPLSWKPEICMVCLWEASTFDRIFKKMVERNAEGIIIVGTRARGGYEGMLFNADNVLAYANAATTFPPGRTCLTLAWKWRHVLEIPVVD